ncbi:nucleolar zinc-finger protein, partial [Bonamia ostreae]
MVSVDIPKFREIIIMSTNCDHCGNRTSDLQGSSYIHEKGKEINLKMTTAEDLKREVVRTDSTVVSIPEIEFVSYQGPNIGEITTTEGLLIKFKEQIESIYKRELENKKLTEKLKKSYQKNISDLKDLAELKKPFTMNFKDVLGDVYVEKLKNDQNLKIDFFERTKEQNAE